MSIDGNGTLEGLEQFMARLGRIDARAARAGALTTWGLHPQRADPDSSLALDDAGFMPDRSPLVESMALWPIMAATDSLTTASELMLRVTKKTDFSTKAQLRAPSVMGLCRSAVESSGRTIWLLGNQDRDVRRQRAVGLLVNELKQQTNYNGNEVDNLRTGKIAAPPQQRKAFEKGHKELLIEYNQLKSNTAAYESPPGFGTTTERAADWIDEHIPPHDRGELAKGGMAIGVRRMYSISSAVGHGMQWANDYARNGDLFAMLAEALAASVNMTECAVALIEAHSQSPTNATRRRRQYPRQLEPTITEWKRLFPSTA
ncbi:hypothetical protein FOS14_24245 [Skermania sp. ID1734]|uniref:hypothetical protein n=1 Tax=Skermania sp. ID1734 TaxID=2597516 RepID=UPI00117FEA17|nr:hypothetical protein [Skermania sp. ID1734]TSD92904.1 hypothetical protein FOS14_24245 [Skermania sp. ID1734]